MSRTRRVRQRRLRRGQARRARKARPAPEAQPGGGPLETLRTLVVALLLALAIRTFVVQTFYVPSGSMLPSLLVGDHVFVNKFLFGICVPRTDVCLPGLRTPARGDVVVFRAARTPDGRVEAADRRPDLPTEDFVKRVVAVPGDRVELRAGRLYLNGKPLPRSASGEAFEDPNGRRLVRAVEHGPRCRYGTLRDPARRGTDHPELRVEEGRYFVMGDNRDHSYDSRFFGTVRLREIHGPAGLVYWSWDFTGSWASLLHPGTWWRNLRERTRWSRIGDSVGCKGPEHAAESPQGAD